MTLFDSALVIAATPVRAAITHIQFHTAAPGAAGTSNVAAGARIAVTWGTIDSDGDFQNSADIAKTDGTASGPCTHISYWTAITAGTCHGAEALTGDQTFNSAGAYTIQTGSLVINATAV
jgi:hypothetical protein